MKQGKCHPGRTLERHLKAEELGHRVDVVTVHGVPTYFCQDCAARGSWQWRKLLDPCRGAPKSPLDMKWLRAALDGGAELNLPKPAATKRAHKTAEPRKPKKVVHKHAVKPIKDPLRNVAGASKGDKDRWELLGNGSCQQVCFPCMPLFPAPASTTQSPVHPPPPALQRQAPHAHRPTVGLRPAPADPEEDLEGDEECPICAAVVLASDAECMQCGLKRLAAGPASSEVQPTTDVGQLVGRTLDIPGVAPSSQNGRPVHLHASISSPVQRVTKSCKVKRPSNVVTTPSRAKCTRPSLSAEPSKTPADDLGQRDELHTSYSWWHGGTLAPPPFMANSAVTGAGNPLKRQRATTNLAEAPSDSQRKRKKATTYASQPRTHTLRRPRPTRAKPAASGADLKGASAAAATRAADQGLPAGPGPPPGRRRLPSPGSPAETSGGTGSGNSAATGPTEDPQRESYVSPAQRRMAELLLRVRAKRARTTSDYG